MEKIFSPDVQEYLRETGVLEREIDRIKFNTLKGITIARLTTVIRCLKDDDYDKIMSMTAESLAGDGNGDENHFIDFGDIINDMGQSEDIYSISELLKMLHERINHG